MTTPDAPRDRDGKVPGTLLPGSTPAGAAEIAADLEAFLRRSFHIPADDLAFTRQVNLWDEGYVDSAGVWETIAYLEGRWRITLPEQVVFDPRFTHVAGMAGLIAEVLHRAEP